MSAVFGTKLSLQHPGLISEGTFASHCKACRLPFLCLHLLKTKQHPAQLNWDSYFCPVALLQTCHFAAFFLFMDDGASIT